MFCDHEVLESLLDIKILIKTGEIYKGLNKLFFLGKGGLYKFVTPYDHKMF